MGVLRLNICTALLVELIIISTYHIAGSDTTFQTDPEHNDLKRATSTVGAVLYKRHATPESQWSSKSDMSVLNPKVRSLTLNNPTNGIITDQSTNTFLTSTLQDEKIIAMPRIVDGTRVPGRFDFPYYAWTAGAIPPCGGTLIHPDIVLTSASCQGDFAAGVNIGGLFLDGRQSENLQSVQELLHPQFDAATKRNDLMLVKLGSNSISTPVQLNFDAANDPATGDGLTIIGFGATIEFGDSSENLLKADITTISQTDCDAFWATKGVQVNGALQICAGSASGSPDFCEGDEGGPIVSATGAQVGIISFTEGCGRPGTPGVYTRLSAYETFIRRGICDLSAFPPPPDQCPTFPPTIAPTSSPTSKPSTAKPTSTPTQDPTTKPTLTPTQDPTTKPTLTPTQDPTATPTSTPTQEPTATLTSVPSKSSSTKNPTAPPTSIPTGTTATPTVSPSLSVGTPRPTLVTDPSATAAPTTTTEFPTVSPSLSVGTSRPTLVTDPPATAAPTTTTVIPTVSPSLSVGTPSPTLVTDQPTTAVPTTTTETPTTETLPPTITVSTDLPTATSSIVTVVPTVTPTTSIPTSTFSPTTSTIAPTTSIPVRRVTAKPATRAPSSGSIIPDATDAPTGCFSKKSRMGKGMGTNGNGMVMGGKGMNSGPTQSPTTSLTPTSSFAPTMSSKKGKGMKSQPTLIPTITNFPTISVSPTENSKRKSGKGKGKNRSPTPTLIPTISSYPTITGQPSKSSKAKKGKGKAKGSSPTLSPTTSFFPSASLSPVKSKSGKQGKGMGIAPTTMPTTTISPTPICDNNMRKPQGKGMMSTSKGKIRASSNIFIRNENKSKGISTLLNLFDV